MNGMLHRELPTSLGNRIFAGLMICLILMLLAFACWDAVNIRRFIANAYIADGKVVGFGKKPGSALGEGDNCPVVQFTLEDGRDVTFRSRTSSRPTPFRVGQAVRVYYQPSNPKDARIDHFTTMHFKSLVFSGMTLVPLFMLFCLWLQRFNK